MTNGASVRSTEYAKGNQCKGEVPIKSLIQRKFLNVEKLMSTDMSLTIHLGYSLRSYHGIKCKYPFDHCMDPAKKALVAYYYFADVAFTIIITYSSSTTPQLRTILKHRVFSPLSRLHLRMEFYQPIKCTFPLNLSSF